jgi:hypothetical protein
MSHRCHDEYFYVDPGAEEPSPPVNHIHREDPWGEDIGVAMLPQDGAFHCHHGILHPLLPGIVENDEAYGCHHQFNELLADDPGADEPTPPAAHNEDDNENHVRPRPVHLPHNILRSNNGNVTGHVLPKDIFVVDDPGAVEPPPAREQADPWCDMQVDATTDHCRLHSLNPRRSPPGNKISKDLFLAPLVEETNEAEAVATTRIRTKQMNAADRSAALSPSQSEMGRDAAAPSRGTTSSLHPHYLTGGRNAPAASREEPVHPDTFRRYFNHLVDEDEGDDLGALEPPPPREFEKDPWEDLDAVEIHRQLHHYYPNGLPPPTSHNTNPTKNAFGRSEALAPVVEDDERKAEEAKTYVTWFHYKRAPEIFPHAVVESD